MSGVTRSILATMTVLVIGLIIREPHQAHRPPELRSTITAAEAFAARA